VSRPHRPSDLAAAWPRALVETLSLVAIDRTDSTQRRARRLLDRHLAEDERPRPFAVVAIEQVAGRGRQGRSWASGAGRGVWASLVAAQSREALQTLPMRVAVALAERLRETTGVDCRLKWPNDLVVRGRKLGGLLIDVVQPGDGEPWAVVGFGVNLLPPSSEPAAAVATSLAGEAGTGVLLPPIGACTMELLDAASHALATPEAHWLERYRGLSVHAAGDRLCCHLPDGEVEGLFLGFDDQGFLRLSVGGSERVIRSGEVFAW
jgi:BirA family biotin operon repressor/biotin-[acetyl-CoA-carboxylase] ligase